MSAEEGVQMEPDQITVEEPTNQVLAKLRQRFPEQGWTSATPDRFEGTCGALRLVLTRCEAAGRWRLVRGVRENTGPDALALVQRS